MKKILLHTCCGPCFLGTFKGIPKDFKVTNYFYNPNIWPEDEYQKRKENLQKVAADLGTDLIEGEYFPEEHANAIKGLEAEFPGRCVECYRLRLTETAAYAKQNDFDVFSTTLLVSPYQQHEKIRKLGEEIGEKFGILFFYQDFRPYFREGQDSARQKEIYRQKYCGCQYSKDYR